MKNDALTGALWRTEFLSVLSRAVESSRERNSGLALLFIGLDNMRHFNCHPGVLAGDAVLTKFVSLARPLLGPTHSIARVGGDEFMIAMPDASQQEAVSLAQAICDMTRRELRSANTGPCGEPGCLGVAQLTASIGVSMLAPGMSVEDLLTEVDVKMYTAKTEGRDRVVC